MSLTALLPLIKNEYNFHVYHTVPVEKGYRLETNVGPKFVAVWEQEDVLQWSFLWREEVAKNGFRQIDRFIRSRDGSPYVQYFEKYIVIQDLFIGKPLPLEIQENWGLLGNKLGLLFSVFKNVTMRLQASQKQLQAMNRNFPRVMDVKEFQQIKKEMVLQPKNMFVYLVQSHWNSIERRLKQAIALSGPSTNRGKHYLSPIHLNLSNWIVLDDTFLSYSSREQQVGRDWQSLVMLIQELYIEYGGSLDKIDALMSEFGKVYQLTIDEWYSLLYLSMYPRVFLELIQAYLQEEKACMEEKTEEYAERWMSECVKQDKLDVLHLWFAERIDRVREETISL